MEEELNEDQLNDKIAARFKELPKVVQNAITSADVEKQLRTLADGHKLHLDQWDALQNEVMLTLMGFQEPSELASNIKKELNCSTDTAAELALDISKIVFEPIRQELERQLEHPEAQAKQVSNVDRATAQELSSAQEVPGASSQVPGGIQVPVARGQVIGENQGTVVVGQASGENKTETEKKVERAQVSEAYKSGEASSVRKDVHNDPYREMP